MIPQVKKIIDVRRHEDRFSAVVRTTEGDTICYSHNPRDGWIRQSYRDNPTVFITASEVPPEVLGRLSIDVN